MTARGKRSAGTDRLGTPSITKNSLWATIAIPWAALLFPDTSMLGADKDAWAPAGFLLMGIVSILVSAWIGRAYARRIRPDLFGE